MARRTLTRKLELYSIHAHVERDPVDYGRLLRRLAKQPVRRRTLIDEESLVAISRLTVSSGTARLVALEGPVDINPAVYDLESQTVRAHALGPGEVVVTRTHVVIDVKSRRAIIEFNQRGAKAKEIANVLENAGRQLKGFEGLEVSFTPVIGEDFAAALDRFDRIKSARVRMRRPNYDWSDWADDLTDAAASSNAQSANVEFRARRGQSLDKADGVVGFLRRTVSRGGPTPVESASVKGRRPEDATDTTISTGGFVRHRRTELQRGPDGQVRDDDAFRALQEFDKEVEQDEGAEDTDEL